MAAETEPNMVLSGLFRPRNFAVPMPGSRDITFTWPRRLTEAEWAHFMAVLEAMKPGLVKP